MATPALWSSPPTCLNLADDEVHVWRTPIHSEPAVLRRYEELLSADEKERANKFLVHDARDNFVAVRGILRKLLAAYLGEEAGQITLSYGQYGKPFLKDKSVVSPLHFNVTHSHGWAALAFARREVGIDIEKIRAEVAGGEIAARFFSEREIAELATLKAEEQSKAFFKCWTRKEAYIKARGEGLQIPLKSFHVSMRTDEPQGLTESDTSIWGVCSFEPAGGFVGAVAGRGNDWRVRYLDWQC